MTTKVPTEWSGDAQPNDAELARIYRSTINDIPIPAGSWAKQHSTRNSKYNIQLGGNVVFLIATVILVRSVEQTCGPLIVVYVLGYHYNMYMIMSY